MKSIRKACQKEKLFWFLIFKYYKIMFYSPFTFLF